MLCHCLITNVVTAVVQSNLCCKESEEEGWGADHASTMVLTHLLITVWAHSSRGEESN